MALLAGVRLSIARTNLSATSEANGKFEFADQVPPGKIDLFVDGRTVTPTPNIEYPALHFETAIIPGQDNQLPHAIYLPPVNLSSSQIVGGNQDVTLTIPGYEGFELIVKANSVTFPDGSHTGPLVVSPVHNDRLPMVPPGGAATFGTLGWTIQPTGTRFDPPAQVKIPNPGHMTAGQTAQIVQWDHDLATFVPMGRGTVSEDASQIITDFGSGITKAGWGGCAGGCPPDPGLPQCAEKFSDCKYCERWQSGAAGICGRCEQKTVPQTIFFDIVKPDGVTIDMVTDVENPPDEFFKVKINPIRENVDPANDFEFEAYAEKELPISASTSMKCYTNSDTKILPSTEDAVYYQDLFLDLKESSRFPFGPSTYGHYFVTSEEAKVTVLGCGIREKEKIFSTKNLNPSPDSVKSYFRQIAPGEDGETLIHMACHEPARTACGISVLPYQHFRPSGLPQQNILGGANDPACLAGMPRSDSGIGMMQLTDSEYYLSGANYSPKNNCETLWDWRTNARGGLKAYAAAKQAAEADRRNERGLALVQCLHRPSLNLPPNWWAANAAPFSDRERQRASIRRYNGGSEYVFEPANTVSGPCNVGRWVSQPSQSQNPLYVQKVCECGGALFPNCETP